MLHSSVLRLRPVLRRLLLGVPCAWLSAFYYRRVGWSFGGPCNGRSRKQHLPSLGKGSAWPTSGYALLLFGSLMIPRGPAQAQDEGCPRAHCDQANSGFINLPLPGSHSNPPEIVWSRTTLVGEIAGSKQGLGCSANGSFAVCTFNGEDLDPGDLDHDVVAYDYDGNDPGVPKWSSGDTINKSAYTSAALILGGGEEAHTIAVDTHRAVRFDGLGGIVWNRPYNTPASYGGTPISPVLTDNNFVIIATSNGPPNALKGKIYSIDNDDPDGPIVDTLYIQDDGDTGSFDTHKTAAVDGNRVYLSMEHKTTTGVADDRAWLVAIDVDTNGQMTEAWHYPFSTGVEADPPGDGSKSSPMLMHTGQGGKTVVFFDGWWHDNDPEAAEPYIFAVQDDGAGFTPLWKKPTGIQTFAAFLPDPGGTRFWHLLTHSRIVTQRRADTGAVWQTFDLNELVNQPGVHVAASAMTIAGTTLAPKMLIAAADVLDQNPAYLVAVDMYAEPPSKVWAVEMPNGFIPEGQYPIVSDGTDTRIIVAGYGTGVYAVGLPDE